MICSVSTSGILDENEEVRGNVEKYTFLIMAKEGGQTKEDKVILKKNLDKAMEIAHRNKRKHITSLTTKQIDMLSIRKLLEYICRRRQMEVEMYSKTSERRDTASAKDNESWATNPRYRKNKNIETIILRPTTGSSYADVIKNMREVNIEGITVDRNKTKDGNVQLRVRAKEENERRKFRESLTTKLGSVAKVDVKKGSNQTVMILDIDESIQPDYVKVTLREELGRDNLGENDIQVKMPEKGNTGGVKYAFATLNGESAKRLVDRKYIGKGWDRWRVKEIESLPKCYRCHRVGHITRNCQTNNAEDTCHKCGETGHKRRECQNGQKCYLCGSDEHKAETMRCPKYRELVQAWKKEKTERPNRVV